MAGAESAQAPSAEAANVVRVVGSRTFVLSNGIGQTPLTTRQPCKR